ncbi:helix-turn-helix domain-containing protein [Alcaligenaceae bacterium]|nr:helix-turn-helix domain-containing protein [Alcaligenaceae bacterium]
MEKDDAHSADPRGGVQVVSRTAAIMRALSAHPGGLSLTAIANEVGLPRSTVQRLVTALEIEGLVDGKGPSGGTRLGPTVSSLLATAHADMVVFGRHQLKMLLDAVNETSSIITAVNAKGMVLETMTAEHPLRVVLSQGSQTPLHASAGGKALLSAYGDSLIEQLYGPALESFTAQTLASREALLAEVKQARADGIAYSRNEFTPGISSLATVVDTSMGIYAFEVTLPDARFEARAADIRASMLAHRERVLTESIGFEKDRQAGSLGLPSAAGS